MSLTESSYKKLLRLIPLLIVIQISTACTGPSQLSADVPSEVNFRPFLIRDLRAYFKSESDKDLHIECKMLRDRPTQSGLSYPKYYVWVSLYNGNEIVDQGAVRLAARNKTRFVVSDFKSQKQILSDPNSVGKIFPAALCSAIVAQAQSPPLVYSKQ
jgi:hypothetical protein